MPQLTQFTSVTSKSGIKVEQKISAFWLMSDAALNGEKVTVELRTKDGEFETLIPNIAIEDLAEYAAEGEGYYIEEVATAINSQKGRAKVELCMDGGIELGSDQFLEISLSSLNASNTYTLNTDQESFDASAVAKWEKDSLNGDQGERNVSDKSTLILPVTNFTRVDLFYEDSEPVTYDMDDLINKALANDDIVKIEVDTGADVLVRGYDRNFHVDLLGVDRIILYSGTTGYSFMYVTLLS